MYDFNEVVCPEIMSDEESSIHSFLDMLGLNQVSMRSVLEEKQRNMGEDTIKAIQRATLSVGSSNPSIIQRRIQAAKLKAESSNDIG